MSVIVICQDSQSVSQSVSKLVVIVIIIHSFGSLSLSLITVTCHLSLSLTVSQPAAVKVFIVVDHHQALWHRIFKYESTVALRAPIHFNSLNDSDWLSIFSNTGRIFSHCSEACLKSLQGWLCQAERVMLRRSVVPWLEIEIWISST